MTGDCTSDTWISVSEFPGLRLRGREGSGPLLTRPAATCLLRLQGPSSAASPGWTGHREGGSARLSVCWRVCKSTDSRPQEQRQTSGPKQGQRGELKGQVVGVGLRGAPQAPEELCSHAQRQRSAGDWVGGMPEAQSEPPPNRPAGKAPAAPRPLFPALGSRDLGLRPRCRAETERVQGQRVREPRVFPGNWFCDFRSDPMSPAPSRPLGTAVQEAPTEVLGPARWASLLVHTQEAPPAASDPSVCTQNGVRSPGGSPLLPGPRLFFGTGCPQTPQDPQARPAGKSGLGRVPRLGAGQHRPLHSRTAEGAAWSPLSVSR